MSENEMVEYEEGGDVAVSETQPAVLKSPGDYRTESVASALDGAYKDASKLQLTEHEAKQLGEDFPDEAFRLGAGGDKNLIYIEHAYLRKRLNDVLGVGASVPIRRREWSEEFKYWKEFDGGRGEWRVGIRIYVDLVLIVRGCVVGEAIGDSVYYPDNAKTNYSDALESAKSAAFRRCAKEFGVGLQAWMKGWSDGWKQRNRGGTPATSAKSEGSGDSRKAAAKSTERKAPEKFREPANWPQSNRYDVSAWAETLKSGTDFKEAILLAERAKLPKTKTHAIVGIIADRYHSILSEKSPDDQQRCVEFTKWVDGSVATFAPEVVPFSQPVDWPNTAIDELQKWIEGLVTIADMKQANVMLFGEDSPFVSLDEREVLVRDLHKKFHDKYDAMVDGDKAKYEEIAREIDDTLFKYELDVQANKTF